MVTALLAAILSAPSPGDGTGQQDARRRGQNEPKQRTHAWVDFKFTSPRGKAESDTSNYPDSSVGLQSDADLGSGLMIGVGLESVFEKQAKFLVGIRTGAWSGSDTQNETIFFDGKAYPSGTSVSSDLDLFFLDLGIRWNTSKPDTVAQFTIGPVLTIQRGSLDLSGTPGGGDYSWLLLSIRGPFDLTWRLPDGPFFGFGFEPTLLALPGWTWEFGADFHAGYASESVRFELGYEFYRLDAFHRQKEDLRLSLDGFRLGVGFTF